MEMYVIIANSSRAIVGLYWRWGLFVSHFFECVLLGDDLAGVDIQCTKFGFGSGGHDGLDYLGKVEDRAIVFGVGGVSGQEKVSARVVACFGFAQIGGIAVHDKPHVTPLVCDDDIFVCGSVVKDCLHRVMVSSMGSAWVAAIALSVMSMVESTAHP